MRFTETLCYAVLTITLTATLIYAERDSNDVGNSGKMVERKMDRRLTRRTTLLVDGAPIQRMFHSPNKVVYRRITKKRRVSPKPSYGPPRTKYGPPSRNLRKPGSKHRSKHSSKPDIYKKRAPKVKYGPPKRTAKPIYSSPKHIRYQHHSNIQSDSTGFGEPPINFLKKHRPMKNGNIMQDTFDGPPNSNDFTSRPFDEHTFSSPASKYFPNKPQEDIPKLEFDEFQNPMQDYAEPPVDSYGAPIKSNLRDLTFSTIKSPDFSNPLDEDYNIDPDTVPWKNFIHLNSDNNVALSKKHPKYSKPEPEALEVYVTPVPEDNKELSLNSYSDIFNYRQTKNKMKVPSYRESIKLLNKPWKGPKMRENSNEEVIVGGQYAEPPGRYVKQRKNGYLGNKNVIPSSVGLPDNKDDSPITISSYVNYKNSNMAFSPQNLNDVFSIVD